MRKNVLLLLLTLITNLLLAQSNPFVKGYMVKTDPMYTAHNFRQTTDKGFIVASDHILSGPDSAGITTYGYLIKLDANGQLVWTIRYPKIPCYYSPGDADAVAQAADGGYAIATSLYYCSGNFPGYGVIWLIKTDSLGTISWSKSFPCTGISIVNCIQPTSDHGFILAGMTRDTVTHVESYLMIKTDSVGQAQWQKTYHSHDSSSVFGAFNSVIQTYDGGYVACGQGLAPCNYGSVMRMDANGDIIWCRKPQGVRSEFTDVQETNDHHYVLSGTGPNANNQLLHRMCKIDDWGNTIWSREIFTFPSTQDQLSSVVVENDGYTFAGSTDTSFEQSAIIHTDTSGNVMWYHTFPQVYPTISPSIALADSGYVYNTTCQTNGSNGWFIGLGVIKTDQQGWSTCTMQSPPYTVNTIPPLDTLSIIAVNENFPINTPDVVSELVNLNDTTYCFVTSITEAQPSSHLVLYPNPTNGNAYLELPQDGGKYRVTVYNELGQLQHIALQTTAFTVELPTSTLTPGIYVVRVMAEDGIALHVRFVKTD